MESLSGFIPSLVLLGAVALFAMGLTTSRRLVRSGSRFVTSAVWIGMFSILAQALHFWEEVETGFSLRFPALFGQPPMSSLFFVSFNVSWLVIWGLSVWGITHRIRAALFPLWFLAIASCMNGLAHPALALITGGYFPGLISSPLVGLIGILFYRALGEATEPSTSLTRPP